SAGTETSRRTVVAALPSVWTAPTMKPPPWRVAVQPVGTPETARSTRVGESVFTLRSKLTLLPGETVTDGYGVVSVRLAARAAGARMVVTNARSPNAATSRAIAPPRSGVNENVRTDSLHLP